VFQTTRICLRENDLQQRLDTILRGSGSAPTAPKKYLDEIYTTVLKQSVPPEYTDKKKEEAFWPA
jgi:hypothetical protein